MNIRENFVRRIGRRSGGCAEVSNDVSSVSCQSVLVVGGGDAGRLLISEMMQNPSWGYQPIAVVDDNLRKHGPLVNGIPIVGSSGDIPELVHRYGVDVIAIAMPSASASEMGRIVNIARRTSVRVLTMSSIESLLRGDRKLTDLKKVELGDILGRPTIASDVESCHHFIAGRRVLVTGAAGSIGQEVVQQVARLAPAQIIALDVNESGLFDLKLDILEKAPTVDVQLVVASVTNARRLQGVFTQFRPQVVFHAAAYKHVPLMELYPEEAVMVNAVGTYRVATAAAAAGVERFVLVSSDKAVHPSSVMGATKRIAELAVKAVAAQTNLSACSVRFGNVLGSRGSVIPTFERQIAAGGPVTITHPEMYRYFMTIPEAASLIVQAGAFGDTDAIYMLDMGEEVSILQLADRMIRQRGLRVGEDIKIEITGMRPGEKLREELSLSSEDAYQTGHPKIRLLRENGRNRSDAKATIQDLRLLEEIARVGYPSELVDQVFAMVATADGVVSGLQFRGHEDGHRNGTSRLHSTENSELAISA